MNIVDYKKVKEYDGAHGEKNVDLKLINNTPALILKNYNPDTGELLANETEIAVDVKALRTRVADLQDQMDNILELIADAEALIK